ncbi:MAG: preprotein translocase subunit SecG [Candidatus Pacebacteria bacterium]|nr:preprotein translocase subunit SecG [Candidatus Paceibacterota bacterium]
MATIVLVIHIILALALVGIILIQKSEGGGLGIGGSGGGGFMTARGTTNLLTRTTAIIAGMFIVTSLTLGIIASRNRSPDRNFIEQAIKPVDAPAVPVEIPSIGPKTIEPVAPAAPAQPAVPMAK